MEKRVESLEMTEQEWQANPPASKTDVERIWDKLQDMEDRSRRNNVRFFGFPEGKEGGDAVKFLEELLPNLLNIKGRREIERAHRIAGQRPATGDRPRPILARFLRSSDRDAVLRAARNKGKLSWGNTTIMLFPDYSRATQMKRDKFKECKKKLHEREVRFRMLFPAKLRIETGQGERAFECPREAMAFIDAMQ
ncbi:LINE-1 retrotransposable element ORF1 protein [Larimichthys crocea]|uniref:LINE-1 retrotransposable element ORF1 protein n=1 Tax=Larimichthys crocea TaxID=215358 RepID=A0A6G0IM59_LARCR|nr:LINE-1 retrotransposable element ORF1 protein [Larimichthys crocea]